MAENPACLPCNLETKCSCIERNITACVICSDQEVNEDIPGWKPGKSSRYCEECSLRQIQTDHAEYKLCYSNANDLSNESDDQSERGYKIKN